MINLLPQLLLVCATVALGLAYTGPDLPPGPYCALGPDQCCIKRQDDCSRPILNSLCYCDQFCKDERKHDDCCPDYELVCLGATLPPPNLLQPCKHRGKIYLPDETRKEDCNLCTCVTGSSLNETKWECERDECIINDDVLYGLSQPGVSWRAYNYTQFRAKKLKDGIIYKLGTFPLSQATKRMGSVRYDKNIDYPLNFDARTRWPGYISPVIDQGWCGSDWAVSTAAIASDRFAILSNGAERVVLSPQTFLSCNAKNQQGCAGGHIDVAWNFARGHGLVDENCFPYKATQTRCPYRAKGTLLDDRCRPVVSQRTSRYKVGPPYKLKNERDIMYEIMESGPVQAIMTVYQDFFHYRDGIYRHTRHGDNVLKGQHSVRIVGWGEEYGEKFWIVANSWGTEWGENGYFRIARGFNESGIESFVVTALSDVTEAYQRK